MVTEANARLNLQTAARNVRAELGLADVPADWSYNQRTAYNLALANKILTYPQSFTPEIIATAVLVAGRQPSTLEDSSFAWGDFAGETLNNAPAVLGSFVNKMLIGAVIVGVVYYALPIWLAHKSGKAAKP